MKFSLEAEPGPLVILMRHGITQGNLGKTKKVRGWDDIPLAAEGRFSVQLFAYRMKPYEPKAIFHSDFLRDSQTAHILAEKLGIANVEADFDARTWDTGQLSGKPEPEAQPIIASIYQNPSQKAPGGSESLSFFFDRAWDFIRRKMDLAAKVPEMRPLVIVCHGRNIATAHSYITGTPMEQGRMPFAGGFAVISVEPDKTLSLSIQGESEPILRDV